MSIIWSILFLISSWILSAKKNITSPFSSPSDWRSSFYVFEINIFLHGQWQPLTIIWRYRFTGWELNNQHHHQRIKYGDWLDWLDRENECEWMRGNWDFDSPSYGESWRQVQNIIIIVIIISLINDGPAASRSSTAQSVSTNLIHCGDNFIIAGHSVPWAGHRNEMIE